MIPQVGPQEAQAAVAAGAVMLDVREAAEVRQARVPGALWVPMSQIQRRLHEVPRDRAVVVVCAAGSRSQAVAGFLHQNGWPDVRNLRGGIYAWYQAGLPLES